MSPTQAPTTLATLDSPSSSQGDSGDGGHGGGPSVDGTVVVIVVLGVLGAISAAANVMFVRNRRRQERRRQEELPGEISSNPAFDPVCPAPAAAPGAVAGLVLPAGASSGGLATDRQLGATHVYAAIPADYAHVLPLADGSEYAVPQPLAQQTLPSHADAATPAAAGTYEPPVPLNPAYRPLVPAMDYLRSTTQTPATAPAPPPRRPAAGVVRGILAPPPPPPPMSTVTMAAPTAFIPPPPVNFSDDPLPPTLPERAHAQLAADSRAQPPHHGPDDYASVDDHPPPHAVLGRTGTYAQLPAAFQAQALRLSSQHGAPGDYARLELPAAPLADSEC